MRIVGRQPDIQRLSVLAGLFESQVDDLPAILAGLGFDLMPEPAQIGHGGLRKIGLRRGVRHFLHWPGFRPAQAGVGRLAAIALESLDARAGCVEHGLDLHRKHFHHILAGGREQAGQS